MLLKQRRRSADRQRRDDRFAHQSSFHFSLWPKSAAQQAEGEKSDPVMANVGKDRIDDPLTPPFQGRDEPILEGSTIGLASKRPLFSFREETSSSSKDRRFVLLRKTPLLFQRRDEPLHPTLSNRDESSSRQSREEKKPPPFSPLVIPFGFGEACTIGFAEACTFGFGEADWKETSPSLKEVLLTFLGRLFLCAFY